MKPALRRLKGPHVVLEPFTARFIGDDYLAWLRDDETTRWLVKPGPDCDRAEVERFCRSMMASADDCFFAILLKPDLRHIGNVRIGPIDWAARTTRFGMMIGDAPSRGRGLGAEVMMLVEDFAFRTLRLATLRFPVVQDHRAAVRMYEKRGFAVNGLWPEDFVKADKTYKMVAMLKRNPEIPA